MCNRLFEFFDCDFDDNKIVLVEVVNERLFFVVVVGFVVSGLCFGGEVCKDDVCFCFLLDSWNRYYWVLGIGGFVLCDVELDNFCLGGMGEDR